MMHTSGLHVSGPGFMPCGFRVQGLWFGVKDIGLRIQGLGFRVYDL